MALMMRPYCRRSQVSSVLTDPRAVSLSYCDRFSSRNGSSRPGSPTILVVCLYPIRTRNLHQALNTGGRAPCGLRGCKNWPAPFPGWMSYKVTKPGLVSVLYLRIHYNMVSLFIRAPFYVLLVFIAICAVFWLFCLSYQYLPSDWLERLVCVPILLCFLGSWVILLTVFGASVTNLNEPARALATTTITWVRS